MPTFCSLKRKLYGIYILNGDKSSQECETRMQNDKMNGKMKMVTFIFYSRVRKLNLTIPYVYMNNNYSLTTSNWF